MLKGLKGNFANGINKIKWLSHLFAERLQIEIAVIKLLYQSEGKSKARDDLLRLIGERIIEMKKQSAQDFSGDKMVTDAINQIEQLDKDINTLKDKASEISSVAE
ncbi:MAG: hypothetical protein JSV13_05705 [Nitrospiraceae bacterium]|jgi:RNA processing factor Prp31|nr:MAG: hypothetical protein JSV13_05705 [Nitrospiraceae bacterium]